MEKCEFCKVVEVLISDEIGDWKAVEEVCVECENLGKIYSAPTKANSLIKHCQTCHEDFLIENPVGLQI